MLLWYLLGVPPLALFVGSWWLAHLAAGITAADSCQEVEWSRARRWSVWIVAFPLLIPPLAHGTLWVLERLFRLLTPRRDPTVYSLFTLAYLNGAIWGMTITAIRWLVR